MTCKNYKKSLLPVVVEHWVESYQNFFKKDFFFVKVKNGIMWV